jgi:Zn-dependent alcohol dehydrogenase
MPRVDFEPIGEEIECRDEETVLDAAFRQGYSLVYGCREGECSACKCFLLEGEVVEGDADPQTFIPELIRLYREGRFPFDRLVKTFPFSEINAAIEASRPGAVVKPVVVFD